MKNLAPKKIHFVFNPYPLQSRVEEGTFSGYFTEGDIHELLKHYELDVFKQVKYSHNIGGSPFFALDEKLKSESLYDFLKSKNINLPI